MNNPPVWSTVPAVQFTRGVTVSTSLTPYVTDPDAGQTVTISLLAGTLPSGVTLSGNAYNYNGTGAGATAAGLILRATDNGTAPLAADSNSHSVIVDDTPAWTSVPSVSFIELVAGQVNFGAYITNYSASTDVFSVHPAFTQIGPGSSYTWLTLTGAGGVLLNAGGTQLDADDLPLSPGLNIGVSRSGGPIVYSGAFAVTVTVKLGSLLFKEVAVSPTTAVNATATGDLANFPTGFPTSTVYFYKQWTWAYNSNDGKFYNLGGDGGFSGNSERARFFRYDARTKIFDYYYPMFGEGDKPFPMGMDSCPWFYRSSSGAFYAEDGYYDDQVQIYRVDTVNETVPAGSTIEFSPTLPAGNLYAADQFTINPAPTVALPSGIKLYDDVGWAFGGDGGRPRLFDINVLGDQSGHGDDTAKVVFWLYNATAGAILVPATTFTFSCAGYSGLSASPAELPHTIQPGEWRMCILPFPSYNQDQTKWRVNAAVGLGTNTAAGPKIKTAINTPAGITVGSYISAVNLTYPSSLEGSKANAAPGVYPYANRAPAFTVTFQNVTGSPIQLTNLELRTSITQSQDEAGRGWELPGVAGKGGGWLYTTGNPGTWTHRRLSGNVWNEAGELLHVAYDPDSDCAWMPYSSGAKGSLRKFNIDTQTVTVVPVSGAGPSIASDRVSYQAGFVYVSSTREIICIESPFPWDQPAQIVAVSVAPATLGQSRLVTTIPALKGSARGSTLGLIRMVLVEARNTILVFTPEWLGFRDSNFAEAPIGQYIIDGGIFVIDYNTGDTQRIDYPAGVMTENGDPLHSAVFVKSVNGAGYCPQSDLVWGYQKNDSKILHWGWSNQALPSWLRNKPLNALVNVPNSRIFPAGGGLEPTWPDAVWKNAGLVSAGGTLQGDTGSSGIPAYLQQWCFGGLWFRQASIEIGQAATGGGGCFNGNDITSLSILAETPTWTVKVQPSNVIHLPKRLPDANEPPTDLMKDGRPNTMHRYYSPQFNDALDRLVIIGNKNCWPYDAVFFKSVHRWQYNAADWSPAGTETPLTDLPGSAPQFDNMPTATDPSNGDAYIIWQHDRLWKRTSAGALTELTAWRTPPAYLVGKQLCKGSNVFWRRASGHYGLFGCCGPGPDGSGTDFWMFSISGNAWVNITSITGNTSFLTNPSGFYPEGTPLAFDSDDESFYMFNEYDLQLYQITSNFSSSLNFVQKALDTSTYGSYGGSLGVNHAGPHLFYSTVMKGLVLVRWPTRHINVIRLH